MCHGFAAGGADCEVVEPKELQNAIMREIYQMSLVYGLTKSDTLPPHRHLWAKTDRDTGKRHLLLYHLLDVAQTARALWRDGVSEPVRRQISEWLGLDQDAAGRLVAFWAGLHDLGKASPIFQDHPRMNDGLRKRIKRELQAVGFEFRTFSGFSRHEIISTWALDKQGLLKSEMGSEPRFARRIAAAVGGHHGDLPRAGALDPALLPPDHRGNAMWESARLELLRELKRLIQPPESVTVELETPQENALLMLLAGLVSVADWIGSNEDYFPYEEQFIETAQYAKRAADQADYALKQLGWLIRPTFSAELSFDSLFAAPPRPIQERTIQAVETKTPTLLILEAPTGIGKTEAALYLADRWMQRGVHTGLYMAMPTQATSNQMFGRVTRFLRARYPDDMVNLLLVHGQAEHQRTFVETQANTVEDIEGNRVAALSWFMDRKRSLLAQFGVGTVDQAFMGVLQTKWFFTRLLGLSHKVIIFDEVHAYDTYMSALFTRLLEWLREIGASVIVLSATLPQEARQKLVAAYLGKDTVPLEKQPYPRVTVASGAMAEPTVIALPQPPERTVCWEWTGRAPDAITQTLDTELRDGGCAAVICNTVERAQTVYEALCKGQNDCDVILFHARYPLCWRRATETDVLDKFGVPDKQGNDSPKRPPKAVVVATQVIEQSLDLDFDVMITDLAPIDLLIQRAGRLHRHKRNVRKGQDRLLITHPEAANSVPQFEKDVWVYELYLLLRTWATLRNARYANAFHLPRDTDDLIESVYGASEIESDLDAPLRDALAVAKRKMEKEIEDAEREANVRLVLAPDKENVLFPPQDGLEEDNPTIHPAFQALTRMDGPGLQVIGLHRTARGLTLERDGTGIVIKLEKKPTRDEIDALLDYAINVHHGAVVQHFLDRDDALPETWKRTPALRYHRVAIFEGGVYDEIEKYRLVLSRRLGLQIIKREGA